MTLDHQFYFRNGFWVSESYGKVVLLYFLGILVQKLHFLCFRYANYMLISYYAHKKSSPRLPSWQPSLISFNTPIESGSIIKPCTLKHFQVPILAPGLLWNGGQSGWVEGLPYRFLRLSINSISSSYKLISRQFDPHFRVSVRWLEFWFARGYESFEGHKRGASIVFLRLSIQFQDHTAQKQSHQAGHSDQIPQICLVVFLREEIQKFCAQEQVKLEKR